MVCKRRSDTSATSHSTHRIAPFSARARIARWAFARPANHGAKDDRPLRKALFALSVVTRKLQALSTFSVDATWRLSTGATASANRALRKPDGAESGQVHLEPFERSLAGNLEAVALVNIEMAPLYQNERLRFHRPRICGER